MTLSPQYLFVFHTYSEISTRLKRNHQYMLQLSTQYESLVNADTSEEISGLVTDYFLWLNFELRQLQELLSTCFEVSREYLRSQESLKTDIKLLTLICVVDDAFEIYEQFREGEESLFAKLSTGPFSKGAVTLNMSSRHTQITLLIDSARTTLLSPIKKDSEL